jgi:glycolate oxidase FAD binding subunit
MPSYRPASLKDLEQLVAWAVAEERLLSVEGAGSKRDFGRPVEALDALSTLGLAGIGMYEPEELVMSAGVGTPLAEIEAALAERRQELAFEPADYGAILGGEAGRQTIGGVIACNLAGPRRLKAGAARDHLLGVQCVTGQGHAIKTGGRVVKNVTGYDLCKLLAGSFGTLAVLSLVTFKVMPVGEESATLLLAGDDRALLLGALRAATGTPHDISGAAMLPAAAARRSAVTVLAAAGRPVACLRLEGAGPSVAYRLGALTEALARPGLQAQTLDRASSLRLWREIRDCRLLDAARPILWRLSCPPTAAAGVAEAAASLAPEVVFDWAGGLVWIALDAQPDAGAPAIRAALGGVGHATLVRAPEATRREVPVFEPQPAPLAALSRRVKSSFDPKGILSPGRLYPDH